MTVLTELLYEMNREDQLRTCGKKMKISAYKWLGVLNVEWFTKYVQTVKIKSQTKMRDFQGEV